MANMANTAAYRLPDGRQAVDVDTSKTLTVADSGFVQNVIADNIDITLPATAAQGSFTIRNGGVKVSGGPAGTASNGTALVRVSPVAADQIQGGVGGTAVDNKELQNTKATSKVGDEVTIVCVAETNGPIVTSIKGIWAREA
jgi:hypothetical protein